MARGLLCPRWLAGRLARREELQMLDGAPVAVELFDLYEDDKLGENKKSLAFSLEFVSDEKTMTDEETKKIMDKIINNLEKNTGARLRN